MFQPRYIKQSHLLIRHAEKLIRYRRDRLSESAIAELRAQIDKVQAAMKARDKVRAEHGEDFRAMELEGVKVSLANLRTFPWVREREADGRLKLHGAYFAFVDGVLHLLDEKSGEFAPA